MITRLSSRAWTSHRQYTGKEPAYAWLCRAPLCEKFGGAREPHACVLRLHQKGQPWPEELRMPTRQVAHVLQRLDQSKEPFRTWIKEGWKAGRYMAYGGS